MAVSRVQAERDASRSDHSARMLRLTLSNLHADVKALRGEIGGLRQETADAARAKEFRDGKADQA